MNIKISNFKMPVTTPVSSLKTMVMNRYRLSGGEVAGFKILRSSVDARKKSNVEFEYTVMLSLTVERKDLLTKPNVSLYEPPKPLEYVKWPYSMRPVVVGFGPAGMFAALYLARCNAQPIIIERGSRIDQRKQEVSHFMENKVLNADSNIQFGEGGAGAFSDGKLSTNLRNEYIGFVLEEFCRHGATEDVLYDANPHVGTDYLEKVVRNVREEIVSLGGNFYFNTRFTDFEPLGNSVRVHCHNGLQFETEHVLLCIGHSARDTIRHLYAKGMQMEAKSFSMGVRIEHQQHKINKIQYGNFARYLPPASYKGAVHLNNGRGVYTFCMCPGGTVMASTSEQNAIVTNGMSEKSRDKANANSALLVSVNPEDYYKESPMDGLAYQEKYERLAYNVGGDYKAPANLVREFMRREVAAKYRSVKPSYPHGVVYCDFARCLPDFVVNSLREAIPLFDRKMNGFNDPDAVMTGVETRSSSPVRILRDEQRQSNVKGIYPVGEGAGYAGGITSAAIDGLKTAIVIVGSGRSEN